MNPIPRVKRKNQALDTLATDLAKVIPAREVGIGTDLPGEPPPRATGWGVHGTITRFEVSIASIIAPIIGLINRIRTPYIVSILLVLRSVWNEYREVQHGNISDQ